MLQRAVRKTRWYVERCFPARSPAEAMIRTMVGRPRQRIQPTVTVTKVSYVGWVKQGMKLKIIASNAETFFVESMAVPPIRVREHTSYPLDGLSH